MTNTEVMEIFKKVYIKSADDLPKEKGLYMTNIGCSYSFDPNQREILTFQTDSINFWMQCIKWYLSPVTLPSEGEIQGEAMTYCSYPAMPDGHPEFDVMRANDFDAGVRWLLSKIG